MRHDEPDIRVGIDDRLQMEYVVRRLEQPEVRRSSRLKKFHYAAVVVVGRGEISPAPPRVVAVDRPGVTLVMKRHPEQPGVFPGGVQLIQMKGLCFGPAPGNA